MDANDVDSRIRVGVDIAEDPAGGYYIGWIEDGEWLQYTLDVAEAGSYEVGIAARQSTRAARSR